MLDHPDEASADICEKKSDSDRGKIASNHHFCSTIIWRLKWHSDHTHSRATNPPWKIDLKVERYRHPLIDNILLFERTGMQISQKRSKNISIEPRLIAINLISDIIQPSINNFQFFHLVIMTAQLQSEVTAYQEEIAQLQSQRDRLDQKRTAFRVSVSFPKSQSLEDLAQFHRQNTQAVAQWSQELKKIDQEIAALDEKIAQKQASLTQFYWQNIEGFVQFANQQLQEQSQKVNQLAAQLESEIRELRKIYREVNPIYCDWLKQKIEVVTFSDTTIPYVVFKGDRFALEGQAIMWQEPLANPGTPETSPDSINFNE